MNSLWPRVQPLLAKVLVLGRIVRRGQRAQVSTPISRKGADDVARLSLPEVDASVAREPSRPDHRTSIWRAGAPSGSIPTAGDGCAARPGACPCRRDASHVRAHPGHVRSNAGLTTSRRFCGIPAGASRSSGSPGFPGDPLERPAAGGG